MSKKNIKNQSRITRSELIRLDQTNIPKYLSLDFANWNIMDVGTLFLDDQDKVFNGFGL